MKGFTLIEVLLSVAILAIIFVFSVPIYQIVQNRNDLDIAANTMAQGYRRAQLLAQAVDGDDSWGVRIQSDRIIVFKGTDFSGRDQNFDDSFELPTTITEAGATEAVFAKFTGFPQAITTVTLTSPNNETRTITLNAKGIVNY